MSASTSVVELNELPPAGATGDPDMDTINPVLAPVIVAGVKCKVNRVRARELGAFLRVLTNGAGAQLDQFDWSNKDDLGPHMLALVVGAIPNAIDEVIDLLHILIRPEEKLSDDDPRAAAFREEMSNPDVMLLLDVLPVVFQQEKAVVPILLGKVTVLLNMAAALSRTGKTKS